MASNKSRGPKKKIIRVSERYGLDEIGEKMAEMWTNPNQDERKTLTELRDYFNRNVLEKAMKKNGMEPVPGEIEYAYEYLFDDDTPHSDKMDVKNRLESNGVDVAQVVDDFINSPQTIHNFLRDVHQAELERSKDDRSPKQKARDHLKSLNRRYEAIVSDMVDDMVNKDDLEDADYDITLEWYITNTETGEEKLISDILE